jgi:PBP1b-binding outer membrane lipoprotein LpoB
MARTFRPQSILTAAALAIAAGCASNQQPTGTPVIVDPTTTQRAAGASDDVLQVCQKMVNSMRRDPEVAAMPSKLILLDQDGIIVDPPSVQNARMFYNDLQAKLNKAAGSEFKFLDRKAVAAERARQLKGEVKTSGVDAAAAGADMNLTIEILSMQRAGTNTVQYNFKLTDMSGVTLWADNDMILKRS